MTRAVETDKKALTQPFEQELYTVWPIRSPSNEENTDFTLILTLLWYERWG